MADRTTGLFHHDNMDFPEEKRVLPLFDLKGRTAIVSGAGAGIGLAAAYAFAEAGANVAIWYNSNKKAIDEAKKIEQTFGVKCKAYSVDVVSLQAVEEAIEEAVKDFNGRLDIFVANSGLAWLDGPFIDGDLTRVQDIMRVNVDGVMWCAKVAGAYFRRQKKQGTTIDGQPLTNFIAGSFIATASMSGSIVNIPMPQAVYNGSKANVIHFCKSLAVEWTGFARANTISPGYIKTDISLTVPAEVKKIWKDKTPFGREGEPHELKGAFLYLASDASSYTTGLDMVVDGGYSLP
ncbi:Sorbose reductase sou1 [Fusarium torreyae]|uniref:Sorbose reductase sou1 n=1 Tax=Fusarium torreyae TaxID=1237075 RepID=A0A9W8RQL4_9HYPO|nr:Sorbose reductase sou1 [Fusarium torreyae]